MTFKEERISIIEENKNIKESRDDVLKALITILKLSPNKVDWETIEEIVKKAQDLKGKKVND